MLITCLALMASVTSCSEDYFEENIPEKSKQISKAELIEQALSRMPQTRAAAPHPVTMVTISKTISIECYVTEPVTIHWDEATTTVIPAGKFITHTNTYSDNEPSHLIYLEGSNDAIINLNLYGTGLILLDVTNNTHLTDLDCSWGNLEILNLTGCSNLKHLAASGNPLSSIDLTHLPHLEALTLPYTLLTDLDLSENPKLEILSIGYNQITDLDLTNNTALRSIFIGELPLKTINNIQINAKSFATFPQLESLLISKTPFTSLDLSDNPLVYEINIDGTAITQLDISNLQIRRLNVSNSQLTDLTYTLDNFASDCYYINVIGTPFEKNSSNIFFLISSLPYDDSFTSQLYATSECVPAFYLKLLTDKNWALYSE